MTLVGLELTMYTRLASNTWRSICLCPLSTEIKGEHHRAWLLSTLLSLESRSRSKKFSGLGEAETEADKNEAKES